MKKSFEEIATDIVHEYIKSKTTNGYCSLGHEYDNLEGITQKIIDVANKLHRNYLDREDKAFNRSVEQELSR